MVATTKEGYLIPTYGPTGISPSAGAEAGMAAGRAVQTQREQTLTSRQSRDSVDQQMKIRTEDQRRIEENRAREAAERARLEAARKRFAAGLALPGMETATVPPGSGVAPMANVQPPAAPPRAGLSFGPNTPAMEPVTMGTEPLSFGLLRQFEGFSATSYWDVNAYRAGYGSDTVTLADGSVVPIREGMTVTREDAERDLARRTQTEFGPRAAQQVGPQVWGALPEHVREALVSVVYNYGSLPARIIPAIQSGDIEAIATAVEALGSDNDGVNRRRRAQEAAIIRSGGDIDRSLVRGAMAPTGEPGTSSGDGAFPMLPNGEPDYEAFDAMIQQVAPLPSPTPLAISPVSGFRPTPLGVDNITQVDPTRSAARQDFDSVRRRIDISAAALRIGNSVLERTSDPVSDYLTRTPEEGAERAAARERGRLVRSWYVSDAAADLFQNDESLLVAAAQDPEGFYEQYAGDAPAPDAPAPDAPTPDAPTPDAPAATSAQVRGPGGVMLDLGTPVDTTAPAPAPVTAPPVNIPFTPAPAAGVATTRGTVASEILGLPRGASATAPSRQVIDAGPARMSQEMQILAAQDAELARLQQYYVDIGSVTEAADLQFKRIQLRSAHQALQGAQAVARMDMGDYSMAAGALSDATGTPIQIQPRADGTFNLLANGQVYADGLTAAELKAYVQQTTDAAYRAQQAAVAEAMFKADTERGTAREQAVLDMMTKAAELQQTGQNAAALELIRQEGFKVQATDSGILVYKEDGTEVYIIDPAGQISVAGTKQPIIGPTSTPVPLR